MCLIGVSALALACRGTAPQEPGGAAGEIPAPSGNATPAPPGMLPGMGAHHHPITTASAEAQTYFDQGMALVFGFNHEEAARSFQRASELDPRAPMPYWGVAWSLGPNYNLDIDDPRAKQAFDAIQKAGSLSANGTPPEREYVAAMAVRYSPGPGVDRAALAQRYARAMGELMRRYPDDLDAATLYAESLMNLHPWKLWSVDGQPGTDTPQILSVLESVLRRAPDHLGANHYYIHAVEASTAPERALPSATRLKTLAPAAGHLAHMPAHIYARTGDHAAAADANLAGANADRVYLKDKAADNYYGMAYYSHNLHFLVDSEMMRGRFAEAQKAAAELSQRTLPHADMMPMIESMAASPLSVLVRFNRFDDILTFPAPPGNRPVMLGWWHFARGIAHAKMGNADAAATERTRLDAELARVPETALFGGGGFERARTVLGIAGTVLDARIAEARGRTDPAIAAWTRAAAAIDHLAYDEPPIWFYPVRESLGAALLKAGRAAGAERVFRDDLVRHPRNARSLFGLHESLRRQQKDANAAWVNAQFQQAWKDADSQLTVDEL
jgi:tetratricopeptide (TPR) repeat protein